MINLTHNGNRITFKGNAISLKAKSLQPTEINYGYLYNWWATQDQGGYGIINENNDGDWRIPTVNDMETLMLYIDEDATLEGGDNNIVARNLAKNDLNYWTYMLEETVDLYNDTKMSLKGTGYRSASFTTQQFFDIDFLTGIHLDYFNIETNYTAIFQVDIAGYSIIEEYDFDLARIFYFDYRKRGYSIRLVRPVLQSDPETDGIIQNSFYIGNDDKVYGNTKIGNQVWIIENLTETKWNNGDWIKGFDGGIYTPISFQDWIDLDNEAALSVYNNDENLV